jgi:signal transduction histidine kinase
MLDAMTEEHRLRLLLIDDDEDSYVLTRDMLRDFAEQKYTLDWVSNYDEGLAAMKQGMYAAYLVDYHLGSSNGLELIRRSRDHGCNAAMILITGLESHAIDVSAMLAGASDYLVKGEINPRLLERSIRYAIGHQRGLEAVRQSAGELQSLNAQLQRSEKELQELNASKDKFFSIIAHDLRSPFVSLLGFTELLSDSAGDMPPEDIRSCAANLHQAGKSLFRLLENLLSWSRIQTGRLVLRPAIIDAYDVAFQVQAIFAGNAAKKEITLRNMLPPESFAFADPQMASTVLENLVSNAIKFTPHGGTVTISATANEATLEIEVRDTGVGIREADLEQLFRIDKHITSYGTDHEEGTGLGLILCDELLTKSGGSIAVTSEMGVGSVFRITLPRVFKYAHAEAIHLDETTASSLTRDVE